MWQLTFKEVVDKQFAKYGFEMPRGYFRLPPAKHQTIQSLEIKANPTTDQYNIVINGQNKGELNLKDTHLRKKLDECIDLLLQQSNVWFDDLDGPFPQYEELPYAFDKRPIETQQYIKKYYDDLHRFKK